MTLFRVIPLSVHGVVEILAAPALIAAPFLLGFAPAAGAVSMGLGVALLGLALSTHVDERSRTIPLSAHAGFDYLIGLAALLLGAVTGIATGDLVATAFLVVFGSAHIALTASTRFSVRGA